MKRSEVFTVPNALSFYRLLSFPIIIYFIVSENERLYVGFLIANLVTDILDGLIARTFNMETELGARLDSIADDGTYIAAILGIFCFKYPVIQPHLFSFIALLVGFAATTVVSLIKFGRMPSLHLYAFKTAGYAQGVFFFMLFTVGFISWYYYLMVVISLLAFTEHIIVQLILVEMKSNAKGLYWVLKSR